MRRLLCTWLYQVMMSFSNFLKGLIDVDSLVCQLFFLALFFLASFKNGGFG